MGKIKEYRYVNGLSQKRFAMMINVDPTTVRHWESGKGRTPKSKKLAVLLATSDVHINQNPATELNLIV